MRHLLFSFPSLRYFRRGRNLSADMERNGWLCCLKSKSVKRVGGKGRCGKAAEFPDTMLLLIKAFAVKPWTDHTPKMWQTYLKYLHIARDFGWGNNGGHCAFVACKCAMRERDARLLPPRSERERERHSHSESVSSSLQSQSPPPPPLT